MEYSMWGKQFHEASDIICFFWKKWSQPEHDFFADQLFVRWWNMRLMHAIDIDECRSKYHLKRVRSACYFAMNNFYSSAHWWCNDIKLLVFHAAYKDSKLKIQKQSSSIRRKSD